MSRPRRWFIRREKVQRWNRPVVGPDGELYFYLGDEPTDDDDD
jgi:hypothetical protein